METKHRAGGAACTWAVLYSILFLSAMIFILTACSVISQPAVTESASEPFQPTTEPMATTAGDAISMDSSQNEQAESSTSHAEPTRTQTGALPVTSSNPKQDVLDAVDAFQNAGPYRAHTAVISGSRTIENIAEVVPPDRFHIVSSGQEMMIVGSKSYIWQKDKWISYLVDVSGITSGIRGAFNEEMIKGIQDVSVVGADTVGGDPVTVYQFKELVGSNGSQTQTVKIWIDTDSKLPLKQEIDGEVNGVKTHTIQEIQYDPKIEIDTPIH